MVRVSSVLVATCLAAVSLSAQEPGSLASMIATAPAGAAAARQISELRVDGRTAYDAVRDVVKTVNWQRRLPDARAIALAENKPILWIHALGDLKGFT